MGVKDVDHVSRPIRDPTRLWILRRQDEPDELVAVDPMDPVQDRQRRQHPKRIADLCCMSGVANADSGLGAHVGEFLGASVEATVWELSLGEPPREHLHIDLV